MNKHWKRMKLIDVIQKTETINPQKNPDASFEYIDVSSICNKQFRIQETSTILGKDAPSRARKFVRTGDILFATVRPTLKRIAQVPEYLDSQVCSTGYFVLRPKDFVEARFLFYFLFTKHFMGAMEQLQKGASYPAVNDSEVSRQTISIPPLSEQKRIVSIVDEAFEAIDIAIDNTKQNLTNARELFDSYLNAIFTQKGDGWIETSLGELIDISHGYAFKGNDFGTSNDSSKAIVLTPGNYSENSKLYFTSKNTKRLIAGVVPSNYIFNVGDLTVVMTDLSSKMKILGKPAFIDSENILHNQRIGRIIFKSESINSRYLFYFLRTRVVADNIKNTATGTMVRHTAPQRILSNTILIPKELGDQVYITSKLDEIEAETQRLEAIYKQKLTALNELKQSILHKAFTGELTADNVDLKTNIEQEAIAV